MELKRKRAATERMHFTERRLAALEPSGKRLVYDLSADGLGVKLEPTGRKTFFWWRSVRGKPLWKSIGDWPEVTLEEARRKAQEYNVLLADWKKESCVGPNPFETTRLGRQLVFSELVEDYVTRHVMLDAVNPAKAAKSIRKYTVEKYLSDWKDRRLGSITRQDVFDLHKKLGAKHGKITANRVCQFLRRVFNWASKAGLWRGENPAAQLELFKEDKRERYLQPDELVRLKAELDREANPDLRDFIMLALATGQRKASIHAMRWDQLDWHTLTWTIPRPKNQKPHTVDLNSAVARTLRARLARRREDDSPWVFPSRGRSGHVEDFKKPWAMLVARANLTNVTQHDLRRTLASYMAIAGVSLQQIGSALGHLSTASTTVYARLHREAVRNALAAGTKQMERMMKQAKKRIESKNLALPPA